MEARAVGLARVRSSIFGSKYWEEGGETYSDEQAFLFLRAGTLQQLGSAPLVGRAYLGDALIER
jgi:hypothetical protein